MQKYSFIFRIYVSLCLIAAAVLSPPALSFVPVLLLLWYLYHWRWPISSTVDLLTQYFTYFALAVLFSSVLHYALAVIVALPVFWPILASMEKAAPHIRYFPTQLRRRPTRRIIALFIIAALAEVLGWFAGNQSLVLASTVFLYALILMAAFIYFRFPYQPVVADIVQQRILAGKEETVRITLNIRTRLGGVLYVRSTEDWIKVRTPVLPLSGKKVLLQLSITPPLSGPSTVKVKGYAIGRFGLFQTLFDIEAVALHVVPRARYAAWLAQKYLSGTKPGALPLLSDLSAIQPRQGLRQGIEYYGNRLYQPGDSMKNIDWKHTSKYNEFVIKEFTEFQGQPALLLVNLVAAGLEEADKLAYNIIAAALTLVRENIPAALAVYNQEKVLISTPALNARELVLQALQATKYITVLANPTRYLSPPDLVRLRSNAGRLSRADSLPARALSELLKLEYLSLSHGARSNPCTLALSETMAKVGRNSTVVVISYRNHDSEALAYNSYALYQKGTPLILV